MIGGLAAEVRSWLMEEDRSRFNEETLVEVKATPNKLKTSN